MNRLMLCGILVMLLGTVCGCGKEEKATLPTKSYPPPDGEQGINAGGGKTKGPSVEMKEE